MGTMLKKAFSLIEVLLVVFILGAVAIPILGYLTASASTIEEITLHQIAGAVVSSQMETYRSQPFHQISKITGEIELAVPRDFQSKLGARVKVKEIVPGQLLQIVIAASWIKPKKGGVTFATLLANQKPSLNTLYE